MSTRPLHEVPARATPARHRGRSIEQLGLEIEPRLPAGRPLLAFSGGADSTALLHALLCVERLPGLWVVHVDHGLDAGSADRARWAERIARRAASSIGWRFVESCSAATAPRELCFQVVHLRLHDADTRRHGGVEAAARALRYRALDALCLRRERGAPDYVLTAHHRDDQLETLLLRLRQGTGLIGLAGIRAEAQRRTGTRLLRPLLALDSPPSSAHLRGLLICERAGWVDDPTNADLSFQRNHVRRRLVPVMLQTEPEPTRVADAAVRLARAAARFATWRDRWARRELDLCRTGDGADLDFEVWRRLPRALRHQALGALHRAAGRRADPPAAAAAELDRQLAQFEAGDVRQSSGSRQPSALPTRCRGEASRRIGCAAGSGWQWSVVPASQSRPENPDRSRPGARLQLRPKPSRSDAPTLGGAADFTYTPRIPGVTAMPEIGCSLQVTREPYDGWMTRAWPDRAACHLPDPRATVTVRNRTTGDTLHPFGSPSKRVKLKKLLIDRKIPRARRSTLPLVCVDGEIAWVPGVTIGDSFRIPEQLTVEGPSGRERSGDRSGKSDGRRPSNQLVWVFRLSPMDPPPSHGSRSTKQHGFDLITDSEKIP